MKMECKCNSPFNSKGKRRIIKQITDRSPNIYYLEEEAGRLAIYIYYALISEALDSSKHTTFLFLLWDSNGMDKTKCAICFTLPLSTELAIYIYSHTGPPSAYGFIHLPSIFIYIYNYFLVLGSKTKY
jgi:hypothetical protein